MARYEIDVDFREVESATVEVEADTEEQAVALAQERARPLAWEVHVVGVELLVPAATPEGHDA